MFITKKTTQVFVADTEKKSGGFSCNYNVEKIDYFWCGIYLGSLYDSDTSLNNFCQVNGSFYSDSHTVRVLGTNIEFVSCDNSTKYCLPQGEKYLEITLEEFISLCNQKEEAQNVIEKIKKEIEKVQNVIGL